MIFEQGNIKECLEALLDLDDKVNYAIVDRQGYVDSVASELSLVLDKKDSASDLRQILLKMLNREFKRIGTV